MTCRLAGCLTGPCSSANLGVGDILNGQLFAYGVGSNINIVDLCTFKILCTLQGGHGKIPVTAVAWNPDCHSRDLRLTHLRIASGDGEGHLLIWDVAKLCILFKLTDPKRTFENSEGVSSLAWVMSQPSLLAVVLGPSTLVLWEAKVNGGPVWHRDLAGVGSLHSLCVDPLDRRSVCLCGSHGVCLLVSIANPLDKTEVKQYRLSSSSASSQKASSNLHCLFPHNENTLLVMLSSEILVFDVEFGQPLGSIALPNGYKSFKKLLAVHGYSISYGAGYVGGMDTIYALHEDGMLSIWNRLPDSLSYSFNLASKLIPKPLRGMHGSQLYIMISCGSIWWDLTHEKESLGREDSKGAFPKKKFQILNVMSNGQVWKWSLSLFSPPPKPTTPTVILPDLINLEESSTGDEQAPEEPPQDKEQDPEKQHPKLERVLTTLTGSVTKISVLPVSLTITAEASKDSSKVHIPLICAATSTGSVEIIGLEKGCVSSIHLELLRSYVLHQDRCRSVRWLGQGPLAVSFSSEKIDGLWKNSILVTDLRYGESIPFRVLEPETCAMLGVRTSPSGRYILVLLKDAPSEVWMVSGLKETKRILHVESSFTAVEWSFPEPTPKPGKESLLWKTEDPNSELPVETLVFTVSDGRVETISFRGRKILSRKVRLPGWGNFGPGGSSSRCISIAAIGSLVLLGDYDGNLIKWDMDSGKSESVFTDSGPVRRIFINTYFKFGVCLIRVALLSATWKCSIYDLDEKRKLNKILFCCPSRLVDIGWIPGPSLLTPATLLAAVTEEGNIIITEVDPPSSAQSTNQESSVDMSAEQKNTELLEETIDSLNTHSSIASTLVLPKSLSLFIRLALQVGIPATVLEEIVHPSSESTDLSALEDQIWKKLPEEVRNGDRSLPQSPRLMTSFASGQSAYESELSTAGNPQGERGFNDSKRKTRRRAIISHVSHGMSLASEVLKTIEAQNLRSRGFLGRVKGTLVRRGSAKDTAIPIPSLLMPQSVESVDMSKNSTSVGSLCELLRLLALLRCDGQLLLPVEWKSYKLALETDSIIPRMTLAALMSGDGGEVEFWSNLSATLKLVQESSQSKPLSAKSAEETALWDQNSTVQAAQSRAKLHDTIPRLHIESHPELQEKRLLEYVTLGDYNTAVGFLLSSAPEASVRYYRDSLCALSLASVSSADGPSAISPQSVVSPTTNSPGLSATNRSSLHLQVAKVVSAHAASVGDSLLGVPLLCSAGLFHEAVCLLQDANLWNYASILTASRLEGAHHAIACLRLAQHVLRDEGDIWRSVGILTTGGCLREAVQVLVDAGYIDCAFAYCHACEEYGLTVPTDESPESGLHLFSALPSVQLVRVTSIKTLKTTGSNLEQELEKYSVDSIMTRYKEYVTSLLIGL